MGLKWITGLIQLLTKCSIELPNVQECDATKMPRELKPVTKDCFGSASQDDSSTTAGFIIVFKMDDPLLVPHRLHIFHCNQLLTVSSSSQLLLLLLQN
jgi:hypothetical protein